MTNALAPLDVPLIGHALKHISADPPLLLSLDIHGGRTLSRFVASARDANDFSLRLAKAISDERLPAVFYAFVESSQSLYLLDGKAWKTVLGEQRLNQHREFKRTHTRVSHLIECMEQIFGPTSSFVSSSTRNRSQVKAVGAIPQLQQVTTAALRFFVSALVLHEVRNAQAIDSVKDAIATTLVDSIAQIESFFFSLVSGISVTLNAAQDPELAAILRDHDLFRKTFDLDEEAERFTLAQLEAELREP